MAEDSAEVQVAVTSFPALSGLSRRPGWQEQRRGGPCSLVIVPVSFFTQGSHVPGRKHASRAESVSRHMLLPSAGVKNGGG